MMNTELIRMFGVALEGNQVDSTTLNMMALQRGYVIHPACSTNVVLDFIKEENYDPNSTFYKDWNDVTDKTRVELFVDQCIHYFLSYGLEMDCVPNDKNRSSVPFYQGYKFIQPISAVDLYDKCMEMLGTNVALKQTSVEALVNYICSYVKTNNIEFDIDLVANKEAVGMICSKLGILPNDPFQLLRHIIYVTTGSSTLIKDKTTINKIHASNNYFDFTKLTEKQVKSLASIFYRFKPLFLAFKKDVWANTKHSWVPNGVALRTATIAANRVVINKLRRMADRYHKPLLVGFWEEVLSKNYSIEFVQKMLEKDAPSNFKLIQLIQGINDRILTAAGRGQNLYIIRNGKTWMKDTDMACIDSRIFRLEDLRNVFEAELVKRLSAKKCIVKFPKDLVLTCPASEKNFVGDIPFGSYFPMKNNSFFGVYWKNEWGTRDFDLSFIDTAGDKVGWNSRFVSRDTDVVFSGDITNAPNGAAEVILCKKDCPNGIININRYCGDDNSKYIFFFGHGNDKTYEFRGKTGYMVNPNHIKVKTMCESSTPQQSIGLTYNNRVYLMNLGVAGGRVSNSNPELIEALERKVDTYVDLKKLLLQAGFEDAASIDWKAPENEGAEIELDLTDLKRDTLISLFS